MLTTENLSLTALKASHATFIYELVNTSEWKKYIGDRHVDTLQDAEAYVEKINANPDVEYWVVHTLADQTPIGVVSLIKRDFLAYHDIGFAFLPQHTKRGYAFEASKRVLAALIELPKHKNIVAIVLKENQKSVNLLERLGMHFYREILIDDSVKLLYGINPSE